MTRHSTAIFNVKNYGALGDGAHDDTQAFIQASQALTAAKGGTLLIPPGTYMVGQQTFANGMGKDFAYKASDIITIKDCTQPVIIEGNGAVLKMQPGLKFGSFDPVTGQPYYPSGTGAFTNANYGADLGYMILLWKNTAQVVVRDLELNGQIDFAVLGGAGGIRAISAWLMAYLRMDARMCTSAMCTRTIIALMAYVSVSLLPHPPPLRHAIWQP